MLYWPFIIDEIQNTYSDFYQTELEILPIVI